MPHTIFDNTEVAFKEKSNSSLHFSKILFRIMGNKKISDFLSNITSFLITYHFPITWLVKKTIYKQFCGGENKKEYSLVLEKLKHQNLHAILDYSVEGKERDEDYEKTKNVILELLEEAKENTSIPCVCLKLTGISRFELLKKISEKDSLNISENNEYHKLLSRLKIIVETCIVVNKPLYIDAEESWIQPAIDKICEELMFTYNTDKKAYVYTTIQMYRNDRFSYLTNLIETAKSKNQKIGIKLVRGAYIEKENKRAEELKYQSPIHTSKEATDADYNKAVQSIFENLSHIEICLGTHNEESCAYIVGLMKINNLSNNYPSIWFSQLYGMSDHISYNLAHNGYNVSKYLPFGPVKQTMPYLIRRAQENSSISGQMSKELRLYIKELRRRKLKNELYACCQ